MKAEERTPRIGRVKRRLMVRYGPGGPDKTGFTMNVSETGAFVRTNHVFAPGTRLALEIDFPDHPVSFDARVVWAKKVPPQLAHVLTCGMGVRFIDPDEDWPGFFAGWAEGIVGRG